MRWSRILRSEENLSIWLSAETSKIFGIIDYTRGLLGSIYAALSCLVYPPLGRSAGSFPEQRLVIEPSGLRVSVHCSMASEMMERFPLFIYLYQLGRYFRMDIFPILLSSYQILVAAREVSFWWSLLSLQGVLIFLFSVRNCTDFHWGHIPKLLNSSRIKQSSSPSIFFRETIRKKQQQLTAGNFLKDKTTDNWNTKNLYTNLSWCCLINVLDISSWKLRKISQTWTFPYLYLNRSQFYIISILTRKFTRETQNFIHTWNLGTELQNSFDEIKFATDGMNYLRGISSTKENRKLLFLQPSVAFTE